MDNGDDGGSDGGGDNGGSDNGGDNSSDNSSSSDSSSSDTSSSDSSDTSSDTSSDSSDTTDTSASDTSDTSDTTATDTSTPTDTSSTADVSGFDQLGGFALSSGLGDILSAPSLTDILGGAPSTQEPQDPFNYGTTEEPTGPISIGDPGIGEPITDIAMPAQEPDQTTQVPEPGQIQAGPVEGPPEEPGPEPAPGTYAPPVDIQTPIDTPIEGAWQLPSQIGEVQIGITVAPPVIDWPFPAPEPEPSPEPQPSPGPGETGDTQPPEPGGTEGPPGQISPPIVFPPPTIIVPAPTPAPIPAPPIQTPAPIPAPIPLPAPGLFPVIVNVIEPQPDQLPQQPVQVQLENQELEVSLPGLERVTAQIATDLGQMAATIQSIGQRLADDIHTEITQLMPAELDAMQAQSDHLGVIAQSLSEMFGGETNMQAALIDLFSSTWTQVQPQLDQLLSTSVGDGIANAITAIGAGGAPSIGGILDALPHGECISTLVKGFLLPLAAEGLLTDGLAMVFAAADVLKVFIDAALSGPVALVEQDSMACARPELLGVGEIQEALNRGDIADGTATDQLNRHGYTDELQTILRRLAARLLERDDVLDAELRGMLDPGQSAAKLAALGYLPDDIQLIEQLRQLLPTPTDLVSWMLRDLFPAPIASVEFDAEGNATFTESAEAIDFVKAFGMDLEFPQGALPLFRQLGISDEFAHRFWQAHWELPSPQQGAEMYQRGFITVQAFNRLLRARGVEPYWRKPFEQIIYNPITRVDIRRIHKMGLLDHDGLVRRYRDIGYSPADAELLAVFTEHLNSADAQAAKLGEVQTLKSRTETLYINGFIGSDVARAQLLNLGFPADHVDFFIANAELERQAQLAGKVAGAVEKLYVGSHWDKATATAALMKEGFSIEAAARLFESWDIDRDYKELTAEEKSHKESTKAEILAVFADQLLSADTAAQMLKHLGYDDLSIALDLELENVKVAKSDASAIIDSIHAQYLAGAISRTAAVSALDAAHISHVKREGLLAKWQLELDKKAARLTVGQIQQLTTAKLIQPDDAKAELQREGYSDHDAELLLRLFGVTAQTAQQHTADTAARQTAAELRRTAHGLTVQQLEKTFKGAITDEAQTVAMLHELGYRPQQIDELITLWGG